jgi:hypothetical protein
MDSFLASTMIAANAADSHVSIATMLTYVSAFTSGGLEPFWPHFVLLSLSILASFAVGAGIIFESPKYSAAAHQVALWLVIVGVVAEAACTICLFVFDEGISGAQQSKIIALENRLAARSLLDGQFSDVVKRLKQFNGQEFDILTYWKNPESLAITNRIYDALLKAGWKYDKPTNGEFILGVQTAVQVWWDDRSPVGTILAARELIAALVSNGIDAAMDDQPQTHAANEPIVTHIQITVGIKP